MLPSRGRSPSLAPTAIVRRDMRDAPLQFASPIQTPGSWHSSMRSDWPGRLRSDSAEWPRSPAGFALALCGWTPVSGYKEPRKRPDARHAAAPLQQHSIAVVRSRLRRRRVEVSAAQQRRTASGRWRPARGQTLLVRFHRTDGHTEGLPALPAQPEARPPNEKQGVARPLARDRLWPLGWLDCYPECFGEPVPG